MMPQLVVNTVVLLLVVCMMSIVILISNINAMNQLRCIAINATGTRTLPLGAATIFRLTAVGGLQPSQD